MEEIESLQDKVNDPAYAPRASSLAVLSVWLGELIQNGMASSMEYEHGRLKSEVEIDDFAAKQFGLSVTKNREPVLTVDSQTYEWLTWLPIQSVLIGDNGHRLSLLLGETQHTLFALTLSADSNSSGTGRFDVFKCYYKNHEDKAKIKLAELRYGLDKKPILSDIETKEIPLLFSPPNETVKSYIN